MIAVKHVSVALALCLGIVTFSACSRAGHETTSEDPTAKPVVGDEQTQNYAEKPVSVEKKTTDPYTGTQDKDNYAGKQPMAKDQTAGEKMMNDTKEHSKE